MPEETPDLLHGDPASNTAGSLSEETSSYSNDATASRKPHPTQDFWKAKDQVMQTIATQWKKTDSTRDHIVKTTQQHRNHVRQGIQNLGSQWQQNGTQWKEQFQNVGNRLSNLKVSKNIRDVINVSQNQNGLNDQLEMFNERMKEEAMIRDVSREAEEACRKTMKEHLERFLEENENGTYEDWIFALHPENTQDASLIMEYREVDIRFYIEESDHRRMWNERVDANRQVAARARMLGPDSSSTQDSEPIVDLLS